MTRPKSIDVKKLKFAIIAVDVAVFRINNGILEVLLGEVMNPHFRNRPGLIGGVIETTETAEQAVVNHLKNKTGVKVDFIEQLQTFSRIDRDPRGRVLSVAYLAIINKISPVGGNIRTVWVPINQAKNLAYDHDEILRVAGERLRAKFGYTNIAQHFLPLNFTLTELQQVYQIVMNQTIDKRNFRRKVLNVGLVAPTGRTTTKGTKKPAQLFRFASLKPKIIELF